MSAASSGHMSEFFLYWRGCGVLDPRQCWAGE
jgi:hypothetical protein